MERRLLKTLRLL